MKINKKILIVIFLIIGFLILTKYTDIFSSLSKDEIFERKVMNRTAKILKKEKGLIFIGFGGRGVKKIEISYMGFDKIGEPYNIKKARNLLVFAVETFLNEFNKDEKMKPYLLNYPFTSKNIKITIFFFDKNEDHHIAPSISIVALRDSDLKNPVCYEIRKNDSLYTIHRESYEEALKIAKQNE